MKKHCERTQLGGVIPARACRSWRTGRARRLPTELMRHAVVADADNPDKNPRARMDGGIVSPGPRRMFRNIRNFNHGALRSEPTRPLRRLTMPRIFSARLAAKRFGEVLEASDADPVVIQRHGRPRAAVIGWRLFKAYEKAYEADFEERRVRLVENAIELIAAGEFGTGQRVIALAARLGLDGDRAKDERRADKMLEEPKS